MRIWRRARLSSFALGAGEPELKIDAEGRPGTVICCFEHALQVRDRTALPGPFTFPERKAGADGCAVGAMCRPRCRQERGGGVRSHTGVGSVGSTKRATYLPDVHR